MQFSHSANTVWLARIVRQILFWKREWLLNLCDFMVQMMLLWGDNGETACPSDQCSKAWELCDGNLGWLTTTMPDNCRHPFLASTAADMGHTRQLIREDMWPHSWKLWCISCLSITLPWPYSILNAKLVCMLDMDAHLCVSFGIFWCFSFWWGAEEDHRESLNCNAAS